MAGISLTVLRWDGLVSGMRDGGMRDGGWGMEGSGRLTWIFHFGCAEGGYGGCDGCWVGECFELCMAPRFDAVGPGWNALV